MPAKIKLILHYLRHSRTASLRLKDKDFQNSHYLSQNFSCSKSVEENTNSDGEQ